MSAIADRVTILRRGKVVADVPAAGLVPREIAALVVGPGAEPTADGTRAAALATAIGLHTEAEARDDSLDDRAGALDIFGLTLAGASRPVLDDVTISVRSGEIVGVAGVSGNGQTELVSVLCGTLPSTSGVIAVSGRPIGGLDVPGRIAAGLGRLTEDRRGSVIPGLTVEQNLVLEDLDDFRRGPFLDRARMRRHVEDLISRFDIRARAYRSRSAACREGTCRKCFSPAPSRATRPRLVASQPTRGLDVGACDYVYSQLRALQDSGAGILLVSEDLDELLDMCDRIVVLYAGRIIGEVASSAASKDELGLLMTGHTS